MGIMDFGMPVEHDESYYLGNEPDIDPDICQHRMEETVWQMTVEEGVCVFVCTQCEKLLNPDFLSEFNDILSTADGFRFLVALRVEMDGGSYEEPPEPCALIIEATDS